MRFDKTSTIDDTSKWDAFVLFNWLYILSMFAHFFWIVSFLSLISDAMALFFHGQLDNVTSF